MSDFSPDGYRWFTAEGKQEFDKRCQHLRYLMAVGKEDHEFVLRLAREALYRIGRRTCEFTGKDFFEDHSECW